MNRDDKIFALCIIAFLVVAFFIFWGTFNVIVVKCLAVIGAALLMFIAFIFYYNSKYADRDPDPWE